MKKFLILNIMFFLGTTLLLTSDNETGWDPDPNYQCVMERIDNALSRFPKACRQTKLKSWYKHAAKSYRSLRTQAENLYGTWDKAHNKHEIKTWKHKMQAYEKYGLTKLNIDVR